MTSGTAIVSHTPGPWEASPRDVTRDQYYINAYDGRNGYFGIATVVPSALGHGEANARLIAAAPDLLAALSEIEHALNHARKHDCAGFDCSVCDSSRLAELARAAIAKAEGAR
jgi:hypothetical protein